MKMRLLLMILITFTQGHCIFSSEESPKNEIQIHQPPEPWEWKYLPCIQIGTSYVVMPPPYRHELDIRFPRLRGGSLIAFRSIKESQTETGIDVFPANAMFTNIKSFPPYITINDAVDSIKNNRSESYKEVKTTVGSMIYIKSGDFFQQANDYLIFSEFRKYPSEKNAVFSYHVFILVNVNKKSILCKIDSKDSINEDIKSSDVEYINFVASSWANSIIAANE